MKTSERFGILGALVLAIAMLSLTALPVMAQAPPAKPCETDEHRQFDFWEGNWEVSQADGTVVGTNRIEKILGGCVLKENWVGGSGLKGESYNIYTAGQGWHQTWVDTAGRLLKLDGGLEDGKMVMSGETPAPDGKGMMKHQITWTPLEDKRVKQHWQISRDDGKTWNDAFVGFYKRKSN